MTLYICILSFAAYSEVVAVVYHFAYLLQLAADVNHVVFFWDAKPSDVESFFHWRKKGFKNAKVIKKKSGDRR